MLSLLGEDVKLCAVERGLYGDTPETPAPYLVMAHLYFNNVQSFQKAFELNASEIISDMPNFTNSTPIIQVSEVIV